MKLIFAAIFLIALFNALTMIAAQFEEGEPTKFDPPPINGRKAKQVKTKRCKPPGCDLEEFEII